MISTRSTGVSPSTGTLSIASTTSRPETTRPKTVYLPSSDAAAPRQMKNDVDALAGSSPRAIDTIPLACGVSLNSGASVVTNPC